MANVSAIKLPNNTIYTIKDNNALPLTGGSVTGPVSFGDSVSIDEATVGDLVVNGSASFTNGVKANNYSGGQPVYIVKGTQTATTASWTGAIDAPALYDGMTIAYYLPRTSASNATLNLTLSTGTTTGAIPVYVTSTTRMGTHYGAGSTIYLTYWSSGSILVNGTATTENRWTHGDYWNSNTYDRTYLSNSGYKAGSTAIVAANIIVAGSDGLYKHLKAGTAFDITMPILYASSAAAANAVNNGGYTYIPFTITTTQSLTLTAYKPIFIKGTLSGTTFTPISTTPLTQTIPTSADNYQYMYLGYATTTTVAYLLPDHPIYEYKNSAFRLVGSDAQSVSGHTVGINVPSNAKFTDTVTTATTSGSGNAVTAITASNGALTVTKGTTFLTSHQDISGKADKATTLAGYGITDAEIASGTITLGSNTITPLTSASTLDATKLSGTIPSGCYTNTNTTYTLSNALSSHKFTETLTAGGSGSGTSTATMTFAAGTGITLTDDTTNKKITIACSVTNTDTKLQVAEATSATQYYPLVGTGTTAATRQYDTTGFKYKGTTGTTSAVGSAILELGNSTASGTAGNKQAQLIMYGTNAKKATITLAAPSADIALALPTSGGTLALTSQIPTVSYPVTSVNSKTGAVSLTASDVGALASSTTYVSKITTTAGAHTAISNKSGAVSFNVPTNTSHLTNDSDFITTSALSGYAQLSGAAFTGNISTTGTLTVGTTSATKTTTLHGKVVIDSVTGNDILQINNNTTNTDTFICVTRTDTEVEVDLGVGAGGRNHGIYSRKFDKWIIFADENGVVKDNSYTAITNKAMFASGHVAYSSIATNSYADKTISFGKTFSSAPNVTACLSTSGTAGNIGNVSVSVFDITTTQCTVRVFNNRGSALSPAIEWIAVNV